MSSDVVVLRPEVCSFLQKLHLKFRERIKGLLMDRVHLQRRLDDGYDFLAFITDRRFPEFLTLEAYKQLTERSDGGATT